MSQAPRLPAAPARAPPLTHFLGVSLVTPASRPQLESSLAAFREAAIKDKDLLIPEPVAVHAIRPTDTLHLTICIFSFPGKEPERLREVVDHLRELDLTRLWRDACFENLEGGNADLSRNVEDDSEQAPVTSSKPITSATDGSESQDAEAKSLPPLCVTLRGVRTKKSPSKTTSIYAPPDDPNGSLQRFCESIREAFRPYIPNEVPSREPEPSSANEEPSPAPGTRPTLESFPHPDSYNSSNLAPPASLNRPITPPPIPSSSPSTAPPPAPVPPTQPPLSKRPQEAPAHPTLPHLLLHATLLNTIYLRKHNAQDRRPVTIDARPLLKRFRDTVWMEDVRVERLCLFRSGAREVGDERGGKVVRYVSEAERLLEF